MKDNVATKCKEKANEQINDFKKTGSKALLSMAYSNLRYAIYTGLDCSMEVERLRKCGKNVSRIYDWKPPK